MKLLQLVLMVIQVNKANMGYLQLTIIMTMMEREKVVSAVTNGREVPRDVCGITRPAIVEEAVQHELIIVVPDILRVGVPDALPQAFDHTERVHALPEEVARVQVGADPRSRRVELLERDNIEHVRAGMELEADHDATFQTFVCTRSG